MKSNALRWCIVSILVLAAAAGAIWWWQWLRLPPVIVLGDGTQLTLLEVTYGRQHRLAPSKLGGRKTRGGPITTTNDSMCVWLEQKHKHNTWPNYELVALDPAATGCAESSEREGVGIRGAHPGDDVMGFVFDAFPRRGRRIDLRVETWNRTNGQQELSVRRFEIRNPAPSRVWESWTPDPLPDVQQDGDLKVTLTRCEMDSHAFNYPAAKSQLNPLMSQGVLTAFRIEQKGVMVTNWQPVEIETSDATGNHTLTHNTSDEQQPDEQVLVYQWGLWPDEPAWKLRVELSRDSGFSPAESWAVADVPVTDGTPNDLYQPKQPLKPFAETTIGSSRLQLFPAIKFTGSQPRGVRDGAFHIKVLPEPEGARLTVLKITDDHGRELEFNDMGSDEGDYRFSLRQLEDAKSLNITLALHQSRYVEFTVQPPTK